MPVDSGVRLIVLDEGMYVGNGIVHRWIIRLGNRLYQNTVRAAPVRSGELVSMIDLDFNQEAASLRVLDAVVSSRSPHTSYVIHGTANNGIGYIYSKEGRENRGLIARMLGGARVEEDTSGLWLVIRDGGPRFHLRVHGQRANNFLAAGYNATARTHRSLHPIAPGVIS